MKKLFLLLFLPQLAFSADLECRNLVNLDEISRSLIHTVKNEKIQIASDSEVISYVTEKGPDFFVVEAFLPPHEMRIYVEGSLGGSKTSLTASTWTRTDMVDVVCTLAK